MTFAPLRFVIWLTTQPLVARLNDNTNFVQRFVSDDGTYGVVPGFFVETGFGLNAGLRGFRDDPSKLARLGFELDGYIDLYNPNRVLRVRTRFAAVVCEKEHIPFGSGRAHGDRPVNRPSLRLLLFVSLLMARCATVAGSVREHQFVGRGPRLHLVDQVHRAGGRRH